MSLASQINKLEIISTKYFESYKKYTSKDNLAIAIKHVKTECDRIYGEYGEDLKKDIKRASRLHVINSTMVEILNKIGA